MGYLLQESQSLGRASEIAKDIEGMGSAIESSIADQNVQLHVRNVLKTFVNLVESKTKTYSNEWCSGVYERAHENICQTCNGR